MESLIPNPFESDKDPEQTGDSETSKKKKKKPAKVPLPVKKEVAETREEKKEKEEKQSVEKPAEEQHEDQPQEQTELQVDHTETEDEYLGELIIDHSDQEELVLPEAVDEAEIDPDETGTEAAVERSVVSQAGTPRTSNEANLSIGEPVPVPPPFWHPTTLPAWEHQQTPVVTEIVEQNTPLNTNGVLNLEGDSIFFNPNTSAVSQETVVDRRTAAEQTYRAEKRGLSRGVATGAVVGWLFGRRSGRHSAERNMRPRLQRNEQALKQLRSEVDNLEDVVKKRGSVIARTQEKLQIFMERTRELQQSLARKTEQTFENSRSEARAMQAETPLTAERFTARSETPYIQRSYETKRTEAEKIPVQPEKTVNPERSILAPEGRRFEASAWHRIEVDEKTGHAVEKPTFEYGQAFQHEQQQEKLVASAAKAQTAAQVGMTLLAANSVVGQSAAQSTMPSPPESKHPGKIKTIIQDAFNDTDYIRQQLAQNATSPSIWLTALAIVVLLLLSGVL